MKRMETLKPTIRGCHRIIVWAITIHRVNGEKLGSTVSATLKLRETSLKIQQLV